jgi:hypothetical protein
MMTMGAIECHISAAHNSIRCVARGIGGSEGEEPQGFGIS